jgi:tetraacyldisaccharide 4'-kinase
LSDIVSGDRHGPAAAVLRAGLRVVAVPVSAGVNVRNALFNHRLRTIHRVDVPVISIGNLSMGGTGKTPCVELVATMLQERGLRPAILSRGYGAAHGPNDEALVLEENLPDVPHLQGLDRVSLARTAVEELEPDCLILDDGFQHRRLHRDLDIVLLDATRPLAKQWLFPSGILREPASSLKRAQMLVLTRCDQAQDVDSQVNWLQRRFPSKPVATSIHAPRHWQNTLENQPIQSFNRQPAAAFCGLGHPRAFENTLNTIGVKPQSFRVFPDHHNYTRDDVDSLARLANELPPDGVMLTTQKDWVKLRVDTLGGRPLWALRIGMTLTRGETDFAASLARTVPVPLEE